MWALYTIAAAVKFLGYHTCESLSRGLLRLRHYLLIESFRKLPASLTVRLCLWSLTLRLCLLSLTVTMCLLSLTMRPCLLSLAVRLCLLSLTVTTCLLNLKVSWLSMRRLALSLSLRLHRRAM